MSNPMRAKCNQWDDDFIYMHQKTEVNIHLINMCDVQSQSDDPQPLLVFYYN